MGKSEKLHLSITHTQTMKRTTNITLLALLAAALPVSAVEQILLGWDADWAYFHPMGDDPAADDAGTAGTNPPNIDNTGAGTGELIGPDMIFPNFNGATSAAGAWFAKESDFNAPGTG